MRLPASLPLLVPVVPATNRPNAIGSTDGTERPVLSRFEDRIEAA
jgi:hypothetical protein